MAICTFCFKCGSWKDSYESVSCLCLQKSASSPVLQLLCLRTAWKEFAKAHHPPLPNTASKNAQPFLYAVWKQKVFININKMPTYSILLKLRMAPIDSYIWTFGFQLVDYLGRIWRCGLGRRGVSLRMGYEISKPMPGSVSASPAPCLLPAAMLLDMIMD